MRIRRTSSGYRRTLVVGLASTLLLLLGLRPAAGTPATPAPAAPFANGVAKATAVVTKIAPGVGALELALGSGIAVAELKNDLAQAQAQSFDLGLIGTTLTAEGCREASFTAEDLPQPTRADNRKGDASASSDEGPVAGESLGAGREQAQASSKPSASSIGTAAASTGPAVSVGGGKASAAVEVVDGAARQAHATVEADVTFAGIVQLSDLRWDALHRTGKNPVAEASFDVGTAKLLGVPVPVESLSDLEAAINTALLETGISVTLPRVERLKEPTDLVRVTPMRITLRDSNVGKTVIGPGLNATREQREQLFIDLSAAFCDAAGALLVGDIAVSIASGTGFLTYSIGGAEALSGEFVSEDPFGDAIAPPGGAVTPPASGATPPAGSSSPPGAEVPATDATAPASPQPAASVGPLEELCESMHPFDWPDCSDGAMAPLGLLGLVATAGIGGLDWRHQRRRAQALAVPTRTAS